MWVSKVRYSALRTPSVIVYTGRTYVLQEFGFSSGGGRGRGRGQVSAHADMELGRYSTVLVRTVVNTVQRS
jgi:hypothetical protein